MNKKIITTILASVLIITGAAAQSLNGSYFLDNSLTRHSMNPAFAPRTSYFGLPGISKTGVGVYGNFGVGDFIYPIDGEVYTFLNNRVSVEEFSRKIRKNPKLDFDTDLSLLNFGFFTSPDNFWSVDFGTKITGGIGIPRDFFMLVKDGMAAGENTFKMNQFYADANVSLYGSVGHSRDLSKYVKGLKVGARFTFYVSMAHIAADLGNSTISLSEDKWTVNANANGIIASSFMKLKPAQSQEEDPEIITDFSKIAPAGYGFSFDIGAEYRLSVGCPLDGLTFSLSALDLGGFFYKADKVQNLHSSGDVNYAGVEDFTLDQSLNFDQIMEEIKDDFLAIADFKEGAPANYNRITYPRIYAGIEMPFARDLMSVGLLYSGKFGKTRNINELTLSYNLNPCKWFNLGLNWSFLNSWKTLGWVLEFSPRGGVDFFIGSDYTFFNVTPKYYLPVNKVWSNLNFGLTFMVGSKHRK